MTQPDPIAGRGDKARAVLLLPGSGFDRRVWGSFAERLAQDFHVTHVDRLGQPAQPTDPVAVADQVTEKLRGRPAVIAQAGGAAGAIRLARRGLVWAVVLFHPTPGRRLPGAENSYDSVLASRLADFDWVPEVAAIADQAERQRAWASYLEPMLDPMRERGVAAADVVRILQMFVDNLEATATGPGQQSGLAEDWVDSLPNVRVPVLVVGAAGEEAPQRAATAVADRLPRGRLVLLESAVPGMPWLLEPERVACEVAEFLHKC